MQTAQLSTLGRACIQLFFSRTLVDASPAGFIGTNTNTPFLLSSLSAQWVCNFCRHEGPVPHAYQCPLDAAGLRRDREQRAELCRGSVDFAVPKVRHQLLLYLEVCILIGSSLWGAGTVAWTRLLCCCCFHFISFFALLYNTARVCRWRR